MILRPVMSIMRHNDVNDVNLSHILGIGRIRLLSTDEIQSVMSFLPVLYKYIFASNSLQNAEYLLSIVQINRINLLSGKPLLLSPASMYRNYNYGNFNRNFFSGYKNKNYYDDYVNFHDKYNFGL